MVGIILRLLGPVSLLSLISRISSEWCHSATMISTSCHIIIYSMPCHHHLCLSFDFHWVSLLPSCPFGYSSIITELLLTSMTTIFHIANMMVVVVMTTTMMIYTSWMNKVCRNIFSNNGMTWIRVFLAFMANVDI